MRGMSNEHEITFFLDRIHPWPSRKQVDNKSKCVAECRANGVPVHPRRADYKALSGVHMVLVQEPQSGLKVQQAPTHLADEDPRRTSGLGEKVWNSVDLRVQP